MVEEGGWWRSDVLQVAARVPLYLQLLADDISGPGWQSCVSVSPKLPVCESGKSNSRATWEAEKLFMKNANRSAATSVSCLYCLFLTWAWNYLLVCYLMAVAACCRWKRWLFKCRLLQADALNNNQRNKHKWHFLVIPLFSKYFRGIHLLPLSHKWRPTLKCSMKLTLKQKISHITVVRLW